MRMAAVFAVMLAVPLVAPRAEAEDDRAPPLSEPPAIIWLDGWTVGGADSGRWEANGLDAVAPPPGTSPWGDRVRLDRANGLTVVPARGKGWLVGVGFGSGGWLGHDTDLSPALRALGDGAVRGGARLFASVDTGRVTTSLTLRRDLGGVAAQVAALWQAQPAGNLSLALGPSLTIANGDQTETAFAVDTGGGRRYVPDDDATRSGEVAFGVRMRWDLSSSIAVLGRAEVHRPFRDADDGAPLDPDEPNTRTTATVGIAYRF